MQCPKCHEKFPSSLALFQHKCTISHWEHLKHQIEQCCQYLAKFPAEEAEGRAVLWLHTKDLDPDDWRVISEVSVHARRKL